MATITTAFEYMENLTGGAEAYIAKLYESLDKTMQTNTLKIVNNRGLAFLLKHTKKEALESIKGITFDNFYANVLVDNAVEKAERFA